MLQALPVARKSVLRPPQIAPSRQTAAATAGRIAFLGQANTQAGDLVQVLCWPVLSSTWPALTQTWSALLAARDVGVPAAGQSWLTACAPQLATLFRDTHAGESTVAAVLARAAMQISVSICHATEVRAALGQCLDAYDTAMRAQKRDPIELLIARTGTDDALAVQDLSSHRMRQSDARWLRDLELRFWKDAIEPMPLALAGVIAAAVARQLDGVDTNPIYDAIECKFGNPLLQLRRAARGKRR